MKNKILIRICGKEYAVVGQESDEYMQRVSLYIDKKMNEITKSNTKLSTAQAAVLTSINVADDYFKTLEAYNTVEDEYSRLNTECERTKREREELKKEIEKNMERIKSLEIKAACLETELKGKS
jgi:cell division protein ZapA